MRILKSFVLRLSQIIASSASIFLFLMSINFVLQQQIEDAIFTAVFAIGFLLCVFILGSIIKRKDPELVTEVARLLYPAGGALSLALSTLLGSILIQNLEQPAKQHYIIILAGGGIFLFLLIRCFDIKFLRNDSELPKNLSN